MSRSVALWVKKSHYSGHVQTLTVYEECLLQLFYGVTWDGDLISKEDRKEAFRRGHMTKVDGWNIITPEGVKFLVESGAVNQ